MAERGRSQSTDEPAEDEPHYHGHRERLRERLLEAGPAALPDYELLEFLLFAGIPRRDTKPLAKELIKHFGSFAAVLAANREALSDAGLKDAAIAALLGVREASSRFLRGEIADKPVISNWQALIDYCTAKIGFAATEEFHLLFLDRKNALIRDERQQQGTVDHTPVYPREVVKRALELNATAIIMVHSQSRPDSGRISAVF
jgi:DNA repair protein RadC